MLPYLLIVDDFLRAPGPVREFAFSAVEARAPQANPVDGYQYPHTAVFVPETEPRTDFERLLVVEVGNKLAAILGSSVDLRLLVARASPEGVEVPEQAHCDLSIIDPPPHYTAIVYLNEKPRGGTSILMHSQTGVQDGGLQSGWQSDQNDATKWTEVVRAQAVENRVAIFPSQLIHRSEPIGGYGKLEDCTARLVLVALFNLVAHVR